MFLAYHSRQIGGLPFVYLNSHRTPCHTTQWKWKRQRLNDRTRCVSIFTTRGAGSCPLSAGRRHRRLVESMVINVKISQLVVMRS